MRCKLRGHVVAKGEEYDFRVAKAVMDEVAQGEPLGGQLFINLVEGGYNFHQLWAHVSALVAADWITGWSLSDLDVYRQAAEAEQERLMREGLEELIKMGLVVNVRGKDGKPRVRLTEEGRREANQEFGE